MSFFTSQLIPFWRGTFHSHPSLAWPLVALGAALGRMVRLILLFSNLQMPLEPNRSITRGGLSLGGRRQPRCDVGRNPFERVNGKGTRQGFGGIKFLTGDRRRRDVASILVAFALWFIEFRQRWDSGSFHSPLYPAQPCAVSAFCECFPKDRQPGFWMEWKQTWSPRSTGDDLMDTKSNISELNGSWSFDTQLKHSCSLTYGRCIVEQLIC